MSRYIDADKFKRNLKTDKYGNTDVNEVGKAIGKSIVDVVEVVRCKDCKRHYEHIDPDGDKWNFCGKTNYPVELTDYCSYGECKDGDEE